MLRTGVAVMAAGLILLSGCSGTKDKPGATTPSGGTTSSAPAASSGDAVAALNAAQQKTRSGSYHTDVEIKTAGTTSQLAADVDPVAKALEMKMDMQGSKLTVRLIGTDMYFTGLNTGGFAGKWVHADISKLPGVGGILSSFDQTFALLPGATDLKEGPPGTFTGTVDAKAALDQAKTQAEKDALSKVISAGSTDKLPFTAKVVDGYLTETTTSYKMDISGTTQEATIVSKFSAFGTATKVTAPPKADTVDAS